jgi:hypothetical protein
LVFIVSCEQSLEKSSRNSNVVGEQLHREDHEEWCGCSSR